MGNHKENGTERREKRERYSSRREKRMKRGVCQGGRERREENIEN
jgi:hypothetical protein